MTDPTPGPAAEPASPTSRRLEEAALELFFERGYRSTTVRELALACGLTPGALYNHFPSKDLLLLSILRDVHAQLESMMSEALERAGTDPTERLRALVRAHAIFHTRFRREARVANDDVLALEEPGRSEIVAVRTRGRRLFEDAITAGMRTGDFRVDDVKVTAMAILNMGIRISAWFRPDGRLSSEQVADRHAALALRMVGAEA
jgi:AcrR family transcriptional regulator